MQLFNRYVSTRSLTVFGGEMLLIFGSVALAATVQGTSNLVENFWKIGLVTVVCQLCLYYNDFYDLTLMHSKREFPYRVVGFIDDDASRIGERIVNPGIVGTPADMGMLIAKHQIDRIIVGLADRRGEGAIDEQLRGRRGGGFVGG